MAMMVVVVVVMMMMIMMIALNLRFLMIPDDVYADGV